MQILSLEEFQNDEDLKEIVEEIDICNEIELSEDDYVDKTLF